MAKMEFKAHAQQGGGSDLTGLLLQLMGGNTVQAGLSQIQSTLDRKAQQETTAARLAQEREEFLYRVAQDEVSGELARRRYELDVQQFGQQVQNQARTQQNEQVRLGLAVSGEQRARAGEERAAQKEIRDQQLDQASLVSKGLEAAKAKQALMDQTAQRDFDATLPTMLDSIVRRESLAPAMGSTMFGGYFTQDALTPEGAPTPKLVENLKRALRSRGFPGSDDELDYAVAGMLRPRQYEAVDLAGNTPHSIEPIIAYGAQVGLTAEQVMAKVRALKPSLAIDSGQLQDQFDRDAALLGRFMPSGADQIGRVTNARLDELQTAAAQGPYDVPLNESTLADLDVKSLPQDVRDAFAAAGATPEQLADPSFWRQFAGNITVNTGSGQMRASLDTDAGTFTRFQPALQLLLQKTPGLLGQLNAVGASSGLKTTPSERTKTRLATPQRPPSAGSNPRGSAAQQNNAVNGTRTSEEEFLQRNLNWLIGPDFREGLGLPDDYDPEGN